jgi:DNA-directed RNA polymerase specialized sigma24 family protein
MQKGKELMNEHAGLSEQFEAERPHLRAVAYRMLGSLAEAEDAVQEAWLHLSRSDISTVSYLGGWLTTVVARVCLNMHHARKSRREESLEASVLELLTSRARRRVRGRAPMQGEDLAASREVVEAFLTAAREGSFDALLAVLDPDVVLRYDSTTVPTGMPGELHGAAAVAKQFVGRAQATQPALVNGFVGVVVAPYGRLLSVLDLSIRGGRIVAITAISDPARLRQLHLAVLDD